jgi:hypothetical protein
VASTLRLVLVLNEDPAGAHVDVHRALARLRSEGGLEEYEVIPYTAMQRAGASAEDISQATLHSTEGIGANAVVWSHTGALSIGSRALDWISERVDVMGYLEGDWYENPSKPAPRETLRLASRCDVAFVPGSGALSKRLRSAGCPAVVYFPLTTDERFMGGERAAEAEWDVVLVGNRVGGRNPIRRMPGAVWRARLVDAMSERFGSRFAVFGSGWGGRSARGSVPFAEQGGVYHRARVCVGVNNLHAAYYFSNRLPIAMSCGCDVVHNWEEGLDRVFPKRVSPRWFRTTQEAIAEVERALDVWDEGDNRRAEARAFADERLSMYRAVSYLCACLDAGRECPGSAEAVSNPWLGEGAL